MFIHSKWKLVTKALSERKIEEGQKQKKVLEDIQRAEEGERKRNCVKFVPKVIAFSCHSRETKSLIS